MKNNLKENKGITLIALIITIIVLLILAVVTISAVNEGEIFAHANNAATRYTAEAENENTAISNYLSEMAKYDGDNKENIGENKSIYDVAYIWNYGELDWKMYIFKEDGRCYHWTYVEGTLDSEPKYQLFTIGDKNDYETAIKEDFYPESDFEKDIRDEVILEEGELSMVFNTSGSEEVLNDGKREYIRREDYDISAIDFDSIPQSDH